MKKKGNYNEYYCLSWSFGGMIRHLVMQSGNLVHGLEKVEIL